MDQAVHPSPDQSAKSVRRNRIYFLFGLAIVLALGGIFANLTLQALHVRAVTSTEFPAYVINNHIGSAEISDDESGMQKDFCVVHLSKDVPDSQIENELMNLMFHYYDLDGGTILTAEYAIPGTGKTKILGDAVFDEATKTVQLTINAASGKQIVKHHVDWDTGGASDAS